MNGARYTTISLKWPDGRPIQPGDLVAGQAYTFNAVTGEMVMAKKVRVGPKQAQLHALAQEKRIAANKKLIDKKSKAKGKPLQRVGGRRGG